MTKVPNSKISLTAASALSLNPAYIRDMAAFQHDVAPPFTPKNHPRYTGGCLSSYLSSNVQSILKLA